jgi:hypothetical protein
MTRPGVSSSPAATIYWPRDYFHGWRLQTGPPRLIALVAQPSTPTTRPGLSSSRAASIYWPRDYFQGWHLQTGPPRLIALVAQPSTTTTRPGLSALVTPLSTGHETTSKGGTYKQAHPTPLTTSPCTLLPTSRPGGPLFRGWLAPPTELTSNPTTLHALTATAPSRPAQFQGWLPPTAQPSSHPGFSTANHGVFPLPPSFTFYFLPFFSAPMMLLQGCVDRLEMD